MTCFTNMNHGCVDYDGTGSAMEGSDSGPDMSPESIHILTLSQAYPAMLAVAVLFNLFNLLFYCFLA